MARWHPEVDATYKAKRDASMNVEYAFVAEPVTMDSVL